MSVGKRIAQLRKEKGYNRTAFADKIGIPPTTLRNYETGVREPGHTFLIQMAKEFSVSTDYLLCLTNDPSPYCATLSENEKLQTLLHEEIIHIKKYRTLDEYGKELVDIVLEKEVERTTRQKQYSENIITLPVLNESTKIIYLPEPVQSASAGYGDFADDETAEQVAVKYNEVTRMADYIMRVHGDSMEPKIHDGDRLLIRRQPSVEEGEIGIFIRNGERYVKIYRGHYIESLNPDYPKFPNTEVSECKGKVIGILKPEWIV